MDPVLGIALAVPGLASAGIAARRGRGWRALIVFGSFPPAAVLWAHLLAAAVSLIVIELTGVPVEQEVAFGGETGTRDLCDLAWCPSHCSVRVQRNTEQRHSMFGEHGSDGATIGFICPRQWSHLGVKVAPSARHVDHDHLARRIGEV